MRNSVFKKQDVHEYTWQKMTRGAVVELVLMDSVLIQRGVVLRLIDVQVLRGDGGGIYEHLLVEDRV